MICRGGGSGDGADEDEDMGLTRPELVLSDEMLDARGDFGVCGVGI